MRKLALKEENREKYCNPPLEKRLKGAVNNPIVKHLATCTGIGGLAGTGLMFLVPDKNFRKVMPGIGAGVGLALSGPTFSHKMAKWREKAKRTREINKLKKKGLEKNADLLGAAVGAAAGHVAQNNLMKQLLAHPGAFLGPLLTRAMAAPGRGMQTIPKSIAFGAASGLVPELEIINNHFNDFSKLLHRNMVKHGIDPQNMSRGDMMAIGHLLRGNFAKAYAHSSEHLDKALQAAVASKNADMGAILQHIVDAKHNAAASPITRAQADMLLKNLGSAFIKNKFFGPLANYFRRNASELAHPWLNKLYDAVGEDSLTGTAIKRLATKRKPSILRELKDAQGGGYGALSRAIETGANFATSKGLLMLEPGTGLLNESKYWAASPFANYIPVEKIKNFIKGIQHGIGNTFVIKPAQKSWERGLAGDVMYRNGLPEGAETGLFSRQNIREFGEENFLNPITASIKDFYNQAGLAAHSAGITQESLNAAKNKILAAKQKLAPKAPSEVAQNIAKNQGKSIEIPKPEATGWFSGMRDNLHSMFGN